MTKPLRFVHISDTHIGTSKDFLIYETSPYEATKKLISAIKQLPFVPDFLLHTGDVAALRGEEESYILAAELFKEVHIPCYFVTGNHDISETMNKHMVYGERKLLSDPTENIYLFEKEDIEFLVLDAKGPDAIDPHGQLSSNQMEIFKNYIEHVQKPFAILLHFPPISLDSVWLDRDMLLLEGQTFHEMLLPKKHLLRGVFFGHIHRGMSIYKNGILYSSVGSSFLQFFTWPQQEKPDFQYDNVGFYNVVTIAENSTIVKQQYYPF